MNDKPAKVLPRLADYPHQVRDIIRFRDMDAQGHVNNAVYSTYFETGRVAMFRNPDLSIGVLGATFVLARGEIDYLSELRWPGDLVIGTAVKEFRRRSFVVAQAVFQGETCAASGAVHDGDGRHGDAQSDRAAGGSARPARAVEAARLSGG